MHAYAVVRFNHHESNSNIKNYVHDLIASELTESEAYEIIKFDTHTVTVKIESKDDDNLDEVLYYIFEDNGIDYTLLDSSD